MKSLYLKVFLALEVRILSNELTYLGEHHKLPLTSQSAQDTFSCIFLSGVRGSHAEAKARFFKKQRQSLLWLSVARTGLLLYVPSRLNNPLIPNSLAYLFRKELFFLDRVLRT